MGVEPNFQQPSAAWSFHSSAPLGFSPMYGSAKCMVESVGGSAPRVRAPRRPTASPALRSKWTLHRRPSVPGRATSGLVSAPVPTPIPRMPTMPRDFQPWM